jgi:hypothetical protein
MCLTSLSRRSYVVDGDGAGRRQQQGINMLNQGRFAAAGMADDGRE